MTSGLVLLTVRAWRRSRALAVASAVLGLLTANTQASFRAICRTVLYG